MKLLYTLNIILLILTLIPSSLNAQKYIHHDLKVILYPEQHRISAVDTITFPEGTPDKMQFVLHQGLKPSSPTSGVKITHVKEKKEDVLFELFKVKLTKVLKTIIIKYSGEIYHPIEAVGKEYIRGFKTTPGIISREGVYLSENSFWYPQFSEMVTFNLEVEIPSTWYAVSQGERLLHKKEKDKVIVQWKSPEPQEEIFLVAGKFIEYTKAGRVTAMVFLRTPDNELADKYLEATERYISMYERLIGPYPYKKFALVENFWETGFGMPSFTLLGPKIIRFPYIINTSYPHEVLHNWWGNSVFPAPDSGNWSEGLTAYLSDHLIKEQQGNSVEYRLETLQKYTDYVLSEKDFPLFKFHFRHSSPSEAIGYGKSLMFFHMLRLHIGDAPFIAGLQDFYKTNKFKFASFNDLKKSFEKVSGRDLKIEFEQWIKRTGAPKLRLTDVKSKIKGNEFLLTALIEQVQEENIYHLHIPIAVTMEGQEKAYQTILDMDKKYIEMRLKLPYCPLRIDIDSEFDVFRRLDRNEIPPAISQALGSKKMLLILPSCAKDTLVTAYLEFARIISQFGPDIVEVKSDKEVTNLPFDSAVVITGWENNLLNEMISKLSIYGVKNKQKELVIGKTKVSKERHSVVLTGWNPSNKDMSFVVVATDIPEALSGLGRKLPHYHKYSYLVFEGNEPVNVANGRWQILDSPMTAFLPDKGGKISNVEMARLDKREALIKFPDKLSRTAPNAFGSFLPRFVCLRQISKREPLKTEMH
ncbi:MAG: M1 family metallopeptidase [Thermodesulfovibrionales bacterium]